MFKKNKKYEKNLGTDIINNLENYENRLQRESDRYDAYKEDIESNNSLYKFQKQIKIRKAKNEYDKKWGAILSEREAYIEEKGIEKRKLDGDPDYLRRGKWGFKKT